MHQPRKRGHDFSDDEDYPTLQTMQSTGYQGGGISKPAVNPTKRARIVLRVDGTELRSVSLIVGSARPEGDDHSTMLPVDGNMVPAQVALQAFPSGSTTYGGAHAMQVDPPGSYPGLVWQAESYNIGRGGAREYDVEMADDTRMSTMSGVAPGHLGFIQPPPHPLQDPQAGTQPPDGQYLNSSGQETLVDDDVHARTLPTLDGNVQDNAPEPFGLPPFKLPASDLMRYLERTSKISTVSDVPQNPDHSAPQNTPPMRSSSNDFWPATSHSGADSPQGAGPLRASPTEDNESNSETSAISTDSQRFLPRDWNESPGMSSV
jgi:hypothetical protein